MTFNDLGIEPDIVDALVSRGITEPFPIQEQTIPLALTGQDIIGQAKTGTGKTFGFGLPLIQRLGQNPAKGVKALIVVPTRELAVQVTEDMELATANRETGVAAIYGGKAYEDQIEKIKAGAQIIVGTPGRLLDLAGQRLLSFAEVEVMVLDEADRMLDLGFEPEIRALAGAIRADRQTVMFSATWPNSIQALAQEFLAEPLMVRIGAEGTRASHSITQIVEVIDAAARDARLEQLLMQYQGDKASSRRCIIFVLYKKEVRVTRRSGLASRAPNA